MKWKILKTQEEYNKAVNRLEQIFDSEPGTDDFDELELLGLLIKDYEDKYYPMPIHDPIQFIKLRMEQRGLRNRDLIGIIGSEGHISSVLKGKRQLTLSMAKSLASFLSIPARVFINEQYGFEHYSSQEDIPDIIDEQLKKSRERILRLKDLSDLLRSETSIISVSKSSNLPDIILIGEEKKPYILAKEGNFSKSAPEFELVPKRYKSNNK
ncbi:hypothetical protein ADIARSV_1667 [Arcticibacter svalbardensis MN12-7]|uniref:HTH cro/C1-type domain-containing protein n=1 Tax=Arcticibacter svalbardensis MN12-7 TaxID=1150600 RepID=R9H1W8_9SPHI|nr:hypothetical protein [Arcticibacter svalbardensis]EOR95179.1 hypothetical protein ADIARSV_1667 [Arcticibacter svalbardensis MN12-7]